MQESEEGQTVAPGRMGLVLALPLASSVCVLGQAVH